MNKQLLDQAIHHYGSKNQLRKAQEEAGELIAAINQFIDGRIEMTVLAAEVADMKIMIKQLIIILGEDYVNSAEEFKLDRLRKRIEGGD